MTDKIIQEIATHRHGDQTQGWAMGQHAEISHRIVALNFSPSRSISRGRPGFLMKLIAIRKQAIIGAMFLFGLAGLGQTQEQPRKVIKDPAEYYAYVGAVQQTDSNAKAVGLEAFVTQYPNSVMKEDALELLMGTYQQAGNVQKTMDTATKLVTADSCNERGLALLAYFDRVQAQSGAANAQQLLVDGKKYGQQGLECLPKMTNPEMKKMEPQMTGIFNAVIGIADLQSKDYEQAIKYLRPAVDANPTDFSVVYPLALAYLAPAPTEKDVEGLFYIVRATNLAKGPGRDQIADFGKKRYAQYHGSEGGWSDLLTQAANATQPPVGFFITPAVPLSELAHKILISKKVEEMTFAEWQFVLSEGSSEDSARLWSKLKGGVVQMQANLISAESDNELLLAGSLDDIVAKRADIDLITEGPMQTQKSGEKILLRAAPMSYNPKPFKMTMVDKGTFEAATAERGGVQHSQMAEFDSQNKIQQLQSEIQSQRQLLQQYNENAANMRQQAAQAANQGGGLGAIAAGVATAGAAKFENNAQTARQKIADLTAELQRLQAEGAASSEAESSGQPVSTGSGTYLGGKAGMVHQLLGRVGGWSCPSSPIAQDGMAPQVKANQCMRDQYVKAAVLNAWAAECYARAERDSSAQEQVAQMMQNLQSAQSMCSNAPVFSAGPVTACDTMQIYACSGSAAPVVVQAPAPAPNRPTPPARPTQPSKCPDSRPCASSAQ